jgi:hypothetical protein
MKSRLILYLVLLPAIVFSQTPGKIKNIFIITTDGYRWQEVFTGADSVLINNPVAVKDTGIIKEQFWDENPLVRRKKLMPFFWSVIAKKGQLYGNRNYGNLVNTKNWYKFSYPGYNEIFTGYADPIPILNRPVNNKNKNVLEFLNNSLEFKGKVVAFTSWNLFPYILNKQRNGLPINSGYENMNENILDETFDMINRMQDNVAAKGKTRFDELTFLNAMEYVKMNKPRIVFIGLGETDEFAHSSRYDLYLEQASKVDRMISELWYYIQTDPDYRNNTNIIITTDHGRGAKSSNWFSHHILIPGSGQSWFAVLGPDCSPLGEITTEGQLYQNQLAATIAWLVDKQFESRHRIGKPVLTNSNNLTVKPSPGAPVSARK